MRYLLLSVLGVGQALALLFLVPACGGGKDCNATQNPNAVLFGVPSLQDEGVFYGVTEYVCEGPTIVRISAETPAALVERVVAHELLHCAGLVEHEASPDCFLYQDAFVGQPATPCMEEVDRLLAVPGTFTIRVQDADLLAHARAAADLWNGYAGREMYVIVDDTPPPE